MTFAGRKFHYIAKFTKQFSDSMLWSELCMLHMIKSQFKKKNPYIDLLI